MLNLDPAWPNQSGTLFHNQLFINIKFFATVEHTSSEPDSSKKMSDFKYKPYIKFRQNNVQFLKQQNISIINFWINISFF